MNLIRETKDNAISFHYLIWIKDDETVSKLFVLSILPMYIDQQSRLKLTALESNVMALLIK
ncbi:hypothetical protein ACFSTH_11780 [Paenibacillus yanchengensis]|uniref:Uncharacterized protein n=1 Tax=Paenibacillus yanchengensis TaxID=2035833 RepID=A0ABW4YRI6_9BACL